MPWLHRLKPRLARLTRRRQLDRDLEDELRFHLEMLAQDHPHPRRRFGNVTSLKEACRELWMFGSLEIWWQDLRYAFRMLRKSPAFTAVAVLTLALAIGANTVIFSVVNGVMLRSLPYRDASRLTILWSSTPRDHADERRTSIPNFADWKSQSRSFESMAFYASESATLIDPADRLDPETITYGDVASDFFGVLGVSPIMGRSLSAQDVTQGERGVVLSHDLWLERYGGSPKVLGEKLDLNGKRYQVVGVMPSDFHFPSKNVQLWAPAAASGWWQPYSAKRGRGAVVVFGRLKPQYSVAQAQAEMATIASRLERQYRDTNDGLTVRVVPLQAQVLGKTVPFLLLVLFGAVVFVVLIACTNVANLLLARGAAREREIALRTALGATRMRLLRQMFTESMVLTLCAGSLGLLLATWGVNVMAAFGARDIPRLDEVHIDARVLWFTLAASVLCGVVFGLVPVGQTIAARRPSAAFKRSSNILVIAEFALAVLLLSGAGLLIRSFLAVRAVDPGFQAQQVVTMELNARWGDDFYDRVFDRIRAIPRVQSVGAINDIFFSQGGKSMGGDSLEVEGHAPEPRDRWTPLVITPNSGDAFQTMGMRLLKGRLFSAHDGEHDPLVVIINEAMARRYWPGEDAVGKRFKGYPGNNKDWVTVVGLVKDVRNTGLEHEPISQMFAAPRQFKPGYILLIRTEEEPGRLLAAVRKVVHEMDTTATVGNVSTLEQQLDAQTSQRRFQSYLLGLFSAIALVLAAVGIYGLLHYSVAQRTHEIGIRMALGARPFDVVGMVLREGLMLAVTGVALGLAGAFALARSIASLLFGVSPWDPVTFGVVAVLLTAVGTAACYVPARRATRVDPMEALRCE